MATREISTRLVMDGEQEYRDTIANINREYKALDSALKLVESQFKGQGNTIAALEAKGKALNDIIAKQTEKLNTEKNTLSSMQDLQKKSAQAAEEARAKLDALNSETDEATKRTKEYKNQVTATEREVAQYEAAEKKAAASVDVHTQKMNAAQVELNDLNSKLGQNEKYLSEAKNSTDGCAKSIDAYGKEVKEAAEDTEKFGKQSKASVDALASALAAAGVAASVKAIAEELVACTDASIKFESAMAGVAKTTDFSDQELADMSETIKEMATRIPLTTSELAQIMETAGQLGIAKENLAAFTETMAALGVATNMTSDEAATMLAQFANVTGMNPAFYENLGSTIVALGNNFATNEKRITDMAQTMAGAGTNAKMTEAQMLALSTAVTSLGIESGTGGTNMSKLIGEMQRAVETGTDLDKWAAAAGMSAKDFAALWGRDAAGAITAFIGNLNNLDSSAEVTLQTLGINDERMTRMITSLANAETQNGMLTRSIDTANKAWQENTALQTEAQTKYATTESKVKLYKNAVDNLRIAVGDQLNPAMNKLTQTGTDVMKWATDLVKTNPQLVKLVIALTAAGGAFLGVATALATVVKVWKSLSLVMAANPWTLVIGAVAAVATALIALTASTTEADEELAHFHETAEAVSKGIESANKAYEQSAANIDATAQTAAGYIERLKQLEGQTSLTKAEQHEYARTVEKLQAAIPGLNLEIDEQTSLLKDGADAVREQVQAWKDAQYTEALMEKRKTLVAGVVEAETALWEAETVRSKNAKDIETFENRKAAILKKVSDQVGVNVENWENLSTAELNSFSPEQVKAFQEQEGEIKLLSASIATLKGENEALDPTIQQLSETYKASEESLKGYDELLNKGTEATDAANEASEAYVESASEQLAAIEELQAAYKASYDAAYENISNSMGLFEDMGKGTKTSVDDMVKSLDSQIQFMDKYAENLQKAATMGVDEGLLAKLSDGSKESAEYLQAIVDGGETKVGELNEKFGKVEEGKEKFATTVATMETDFNTSTMNIINDTNAMVDNFNQQSQAQTNGAATVQGLIDGLKSKTEELKAQAQEINKIMSSVGTGTINATVNTTGKSHAAGKEYVPYDNYLANLHKGEMVLTALQAKAYRAERFANYGVMRELEGSITNNTSLSIGQIVVSGVSGGRDAGVQIADALQRELRLRGVLSAK